MLDGKVSENESDFVSNFMEIVFSERMVMIKSHFSELKRKLPVQEFRKILTAYNKVIKSIVNKPSDFSVRSINIRENLVSKYLDSNPEILDIFLLVGFKSTVERENILEMPLIELNELNLLINLIQDEANDLSDEW